jgi:hypothetical protein
MALNLSRKENCKASGLRLKVDYNDPIAALNSLIHSFQM